MYDKHIDRLFTGRPIRHKPTECARCTLRGDARGCEKARKSGRCEVKK